MQTCIRTFSSLQNKLLRAYKRCWPTQILLLWKEMEVSKNILSKIVEYLFILKMLCLVSTRRLHNDHWCFIDGTELYVITKCQINLVKMLIREFRYKQNFEAR